MEKQDWSRLEDRIGYRFKDQGLLITAMTHSSYVNECKGECNERLEFLGDSVLSLIVCEELYCSYPDQAEGALTMWKKQVVCREALVSYAQKIGLGEYLLLGHGEEASGREKPKILEDAFEALLGAMYLDCRDQATVAAFLLPFVRGRIEESGEAEDPKTRLQRYVQETPGEELCYRVVDETGPDNAKVFTVSVYINSNLFGTGVGGSKKEAEQNAAREALKQYLPR